MAKKNNRHFSTTHLTHHHHNHPPHPPPQHHHYHYHPHLPPPPPPHHPYIHNHYQAQPINHQAQPNYPSNETTLIQEVLYLHSLWRRGPPSTSGPTTITNPYLKPTPTTHFKKTKPCHVSDKEWPVPDPTPDLHSGSEWPAFPVSHNPNTRPATEAERGRVLGVRIQSRGVEACSCLFRKRNEDEDEDEEEEEEDDGDDEEEIDLFENLFEEDVKLKEFYVKNCEGLGGGGEFCCLVCGVNRKFKNCVALVQHSITVSKTKRKKAHRAYGRVVCKVLGWDVDRLPSLPVSGGAEGEVGGSQSMEKPSEVMKDEVKNGADGGSASVEMETNASLAEPRQTETGTIPDALEAENVASTSVGCTAADLTPGLGDVKSHDDQGSTVVEMEKDASLAKSNQTGTETISDSLEKEIVRSTDAGCIAEELTHELQRNDPALGQEEIVNKTEEGCPVLESKPVECELSVAEDDPFEQLPSLPGAFQIPE
ncbi:hypothetical protein KSS87_006860 [Heliosperma pusillum]|nr:hypothetical protein KSS87_006860 [Heliosperma pusillum]